jgi:DivIVA domain-containing protein
MAPSGESLSLFVVQRTFTRVRRGYDPEEVDRHLQLVSGWFTEKRMGEIARDIEARAAEAEERARRTLEGAQLEADATLEGARKRADALIAEARREAEAERERILSDACAEAERAAAEARAAAEKELQAYVERRQREADRIARRAERG